MNEPSQASETVHDFTGYAQEFLRRNELYRAQFAHLRNLIDRDSASPAAMEMARRWGLMFPLRS
jgi:Family of unknown function (DUF6499)